MADDTWQIEAGPYAEPSTGTDAMSCVPTIAFEGLHSAAQ
jgi:hypothetical protein